MKCFIVCGLMLFIFASCDSYDVKQLYGSWKNEAMQMSFEEGGKCTLNNGGKEFPNCTYVMSGNTLEILSDGAPVLTSVTVKGIENDVLSIEFRTDADLVEQKLNRVE